MAGLPSCPSSSPASSGTCRPDKPTAPRGSEPRLRSLPKTSQEMRPRPQEEEERRSRSPFRAFLLAIPFLVSGKLPIRLRFSPQLQLDFPDAPLRPLKESDQT